MKKNILVFLWVAVLLNILLYVSYQYNIGTKKSVDFVFLLLMNNVFLVLHILIGWFTEKRKIHPVQELYITFLLRMGGILFPLLGYMLFYNRHLGFVTIFIMMGLYFMYVFIDKFLLLKRLRQEKKQTPKIS